MRQIYLDNASTTMLDLEVVKVMLPYLTNKYGNASSSHDLGREAREAIENARKIIADKINAKPNEIIFTGSATEADNLAIKGIAYANKVKGKHIITSEIEHPAVIEACKALEQEGFSITYLNVNREGLISIEDLKKAIRKDTILVSIMHANNEIGTIQNISEIGEICRAKGIYFHTDASQSFTKLPIDVKAMNIDLMTISAHKIHGPKGIGALYLRENVNIKPIQHGGSHEFGLRPGTENLANIVGFAKAATLVIQKDIERMTRLRDYFLSALIKMPKVKLNGSHKQRLCNNINVLFQGIGSEIMLNHLNSQGIYASAGSACTAQEITTSHVLKAIVLTDEEANSSIRFSISKFTSREDIEYALNAIKEIVYSLRKISAIINKV